jgi:hypothetical protein
MPSTPKTAEQKLHEKIFKARKDAQAVARKGRGNNGRQEFQFSPFEDVLAEAKRLLEKHRIFYVPRMVEEELHFGQKGCFAKCVIEYEVIDLAGGGTLKMRWAGTGFDSPGGTALFMAETGTEKYFLARLLQIPWGDDPETQQGVLDAPSPEAAKVIEDQDRAAEAPQARARRDKPLPKSELPEPDWLNAGEDRGEVPAHA